MNIYHEAFLCWGFKKALQGIDMTTENSLASFSSLLNLSELSLDTLTSAPRGRFDGIRNEHFAQTEARFTRKKFETIVQSSLSSLLSVRLREGYTVNSVRIIEDSNVNLMEVKLTLPWKINSFIHYTVQSQWPLKSHKCRILVHLEGKKIYWTKFKVSEFLQSMSTCWEYKWGCAWCRCWWSHWRYSWRWCSAWKCWVWSLEWLEITSFQKLSWKTSL